MESFTVKLLILKYELPKKKFGMNGVFRTSQLTEMEQFLTAERKIINEEGMTGCKLINI